MKQTIRQVLDELGDTQINLGSEAARETIASLVSAALKTKGTYSEYTEDEIEKKKAQETWVCGVCDESTYDVDYDYIGSGTNHLGCELERDDRLKQYKKEKEKAKHLIDKSVEDYERNKLSEQIVDNKDKGYIYESPDGGKTIYKRLMGSNEKTLVSKDELEGKF